MRSEEDLMTRADMAGRGHPAPAVTVSELPGRATVRPTGDVDAFSAGELRDQFGRVVGYPQVVIDLTEVTFIDSAGLGALIGGVRRVREVGGTVVVACPHRALGRMFATTGFDRLVTVVPDLPAARAALDAPT